MGHHSLILLGLVRGRERFVSALSQVKCQTAGVPEHVAEVEHTPASARAQKIREIIIDLGELI